MIYIFGDTHRNIDVKKINTKNFPEQKKMTKNDYIIIAGDFGLIWQNDNEYKWWKKWYDNKNFTTLFVDGNHENFEWLYEFPVIDKFGGKVGKISDSIYHLKRGEVYEIDGKTIFTFGGADSIDKSQRVNRVDWWQEEMPNYLEMNYGLDNLEEVDFNVDYIITHSCPKSIMGYLKRHKERTPLENYFEHIKGILKEKNINYEWYFGHYHEDKEIDKFICCYNEKHLIE
jgi:predicted phosphodiesterase